MICKKFNDNNDLKDAIDNFYKFKIKLDSDEDLKIYQPCSITDIHERIGKEIPIRKLQFQIKQLLAEEKIESEGLKRWTKYRIKT